MVEFKGLQRLLHSLADENRLRILRFVGNEERTVSAIVEATGLSQPLVSHHLRALREAGILASSRRGPFVYYSMLSHRLLELLGALERLAPGIEEQSSEVAFRCPDWWRLLVQEPETPEEES